MNQIGLHYSIDILYQCRSKCRNTDSTTFCGLMALPRSTFAFSSDTILASNLEILYIQYFSNFFPGCPKLYRLQYEMQVYI